MRFITFSKFLALYLPSSGCLFFLKKLTRKAFVYRPIDLIMSCIVHVKPELTSEKTVSTKYALMARQRELHRLLVWSFFAVKLKVTKPFGINFSIDFSCRRGGEGGGEGPLDFK